MSLAKKDTRQITVDGNRFRYKVAPNDEGLAIVVESAKTPGQRMVTWVDHGNIVSPWLVRRAIVEALSEDWHPERSGPELIFRFQGLIKKDGGVT